jgi:hypothetical protein
LYPRQKTAHHVVQKGTELHADWKAFQIT